MQVDEKTLLNSNIHQIESLWQHYQMDPAQLARFKEELQDFSIRLPLLGSFSAGKSSLINFLLKERLLAANVNPETSLPAEIHYAASEAIMLNEPGKSPVSLSRTALKDRDFSTMPENTWLDIAAPFSVLQHISAVTLVDMPGWSSGIDRHSAAIDNYLWRSSAYCLAVSVDEGGLKESLKRIIEELALNKKPMMLVITKADKKPADEVSRVCQHIRQEVEAITGTPLLSVSATGRNDTTHFEQALQALAPLNAQFFHQRIGALAQQLIDDLLHHLTQLQNSSNFTIDEIQDKREQLLQQQQALNGEIVHSEQQLRGEMQGVEHYIQQEFESRLKGQLESLTTAIQSGGDVSGTIGSTLRMAYTAGIEEKLKPLIQNRLFHLQQTSMESLSDINFAHSLTLNNGSDSLSDSIIDVLYPVLMAFLTKTPWLAPVAHIVRSLLSIFVSSASQELAREEQREKARRYVLSNLIPECAAKVSMPIHDALLQSINGIMDNIREEINRKVAAYQHSLNQLEQQLATEQATDDENKQRIQRELDAMTSLSNKLKNYAHV